MSLVEDAAEVISRGDTVVDDKVAIYMKSGWSWSTPSEILFTREQPYQLVPRDEAARLLLNSGRFREATKDEIKEFYEL